MLKKITNYIGFAIFALTVLVIPKVAFMAPDALLTDTLASSTALVTDHRGPIITFIVAIFILVFIALLGKRALFWAGSMLGGIFRRK